MIHWLSESGEFNVMAGCLRADDPQKIPDSLEKRGRYYKFNVHTRVWKAIDPGLMTAMSDVGASLGALGVSPCFMAEVAQLSQICEAPSDAREDGDGDGDGDGRRQRRHRIRNVLFGGWNPESYQTVTRPNGSVSMLRGSYWSTLRFQEEGCDDYFKVALPSTSTRERDLPLNVAGANVAIADADVSTM